MTTPPEEPEVPQDATGPTPPPGPPPSPAAPNPAAAAGGAAAMPAAMNEYVDALKGIRSSSLPIQLGWAGGGLGILVFIAVLLPWETAKSAYGSGSVSGFGSGQHGWIPFVICIAVGAFGIFRAVKNTYAREYAYAAIAAGAITLLICIIDMIGNHNDANQLDKLQGLSSGIGVDTSGSIGNGFGIWLTLILGVAFAAVGALALTRKDD
jgi:hypothetical protein